MFNECRCILILFTFHVKSEKTVGPLHITLSLRVQLVHKDRVFDNHCKSRAKENHSSVCLYLTPSSDYSNLITIQGVYNVSQNNENDIEFSFD